LLPSERAGTTGPGRHHERNRTPEVEGDIMSSTAVAPVREDQLVRTSRVALGALGVQFLLGIGTNLIGPPGEDPGANVVGGIVGGLHVLVAIVLIVLGVRVLLAARHREVGRRTALWGLVVLSVTFLCGISTVLTDSAWFSFLMAAGWLTAAVLYGVLFVIGSRAAHPAEVTGPAA
jgi:hypothetical protein